MKPLNPFAQEVLAGMARFYRVSSHLLLRVIVESVLDAASEDGNMQRELAAAARFLRRTGHVPDCWLETEGERFEEGRDDSGSGVYIGDEAASNRNLAQSHAQYGDRHAEWGDRDDNMVALDLLLAVDDGRKRLARPSLHRVH